MQDKQNPCEKTRGENADVAAQGSAKARARPGGSQEYYGGHQRGEHLDVIGDAERGQTDSKSGSDDLETAYTARAMRSQRRKVRRHSPPTW